MKILVTGGAGYIGSHTSQKLLNTGFDVVALDNLTTGFKESVQTNVKLVVGDVRNSELLSDIISSEKIEAVVHFAAKLVVPESMRDPISYYDNNTMGVLSLVKACHKTGVKKIVFSSTAAVYGQSKQEVVTELTSTNPITPYGYSKLMSEQILKDSETAHQIRSVILRYFNVAGANPDLSNGPRSLGATHLIKVCAEAACKKRTHVEIFGDNYSTPDGTGVRDFIHVQDLAGLHVQSLKYLIDGGAGETLNCGYGRGHSVMQVIKAMQAVGGVNFPVKVSARREGDSSCLIADSSKARKLLGWTPEFDSLEVICKTAFEWEKRI